METKPDDERPLPIDGVYPLPPVPPIDDPVALETYKHLLAVRSAQVTNYYERHLEAWRAGQEYEFEANRATIGFANSTLKAVMIVNGGAALAALAFLGHVIGADKELTRAATIVGELLPAMTSFCVGTLSAVAATGFAYLAQLRLMQEIAIVRAALPKKPAKRQWLGETLRWLAIVTTITGIVSLGAGFWFAKGGFSDVSKLRSTPASAATTPSSTK